MNYPFERLARLIEIDRCHKTEKQLLASFYEELGELARELKIEEKVFGNFHKAPGKDGVLGEAVDVFICVMINMDSDLGKLLAKEQPLWQWDLIPYEDPFDLLNSIAVNMVSNNPYKAAQNCIDLFIEAQGTPEEFLNILNNKLDKWESTQKGS